MYGALVRQARQHRAMSQKQLAENSGVEQSNISAIENGRRMPAAETLHRLLYACGFELVALAREREIALPPPDDPFLFEPGDFDEPPIITPETPMDRRAAAVTAVLELASAIAAGKASP